MPNYLSRMKPNGANGTEYKLKDEELREVVSGISDDIKGTQTATGNPITLTDGSETYAQGLSVELEPKQDLHGYDYPWVGGAGKNKVAYPYITAVSGTWNSMSISENDGLISVQGTQNGVGMFNFAEIPLKANVTYTLSTNFVYDDSTASGNSTRMFLTVYDITHAALLANINSGNASFTPSVDCTARVYLNPSSGANNRFFKFTVKPQIEVGQTASAWTPYSNISPISGYEGVEVEDVGKNLFDKSSATTGKYMNLDGTLSDWVSVCYSDYIRVKPNTSYYFSHVMGSTYGLSAICFDGFKNPLNKSIGVTGEGDGNGVVTTPNDCAYIVINAMASNKDIVQITEGSTAPTTYQPYQSTSATIQFGQTVYGGSVDVTNGGTDKTKVEYTFTGNETYISMSYGRVYLQSSDFSVFKYPTSRSDAANLICEGFKNIDDAHLELESGQISLYDNKIGFCLTKTNSNGDINALKAVIVGMKVVVELATPENISTPPTDLKLLQDTNNLTTNGTTITLDYIPNNSIGDAVKASEEYTDRAVDALGDLAHINKDGSTSTKFLRGDGTWQNTGIVKDILLDTTVFQGDEVTFVPPTSYNFLVFEMNFDADGACGSAIVTDLNYFETVTIIANNTMTEHVCSLHYSSNQFSVMGSFGGDSANLRVTAF